MADEIRKAEPSQGLAAKRDVETLEHTTAPVATPGNLLAAASMDPAHRARVEKSLLRKLDARCSLFVFIYILNYLDRNNIAAARLKGLEKDLNLDDVRSHFGTIDDLWPTSVCFFLDHHANYQ